MRVLSVADPGTMIGPDAVGSAEHVMAALDGALMRGGHESIVAGDGRSPPPVTPARIADILATTSVDLVHVHGGDVMDIVSDTRVPVLVTLHHPVASYPPRLFSRASAGARFNCVSHDQRRSFPADTDVEVITHGVDLRVFQPLSRKERYVAALGPLGPHHGCHLALEAARLAHVPARVAGPSSLAPSHQNYLRDAIMPRLDGERVYVGSVGGFARRVFLARARALIVPSLIDAPSSIAAMEALACGTPVIAMRRGVLPEIVEHGVTGLLVDGFLDMVEAIGAIDTISPAACRAAAERRFDLRATQNAYLSLYQRMLQDKPLRRTDSARAVQARTSAANAST